MPAVATPSTQTVAIRALRREDLDAVVAIDSAINRRPRYTYLKRRLDAALREPALHVQLAATDERSLAGYILARLTVGEFGRLHPGLRFEVVGVRQDVQGRGVGTKLMDALIDYAHRHGLVDVRTAAAWNNLTMLRWLDSMGFVLAPNHIVDCAVEGGAYRPARDDAISLPEGNGPGKEIDYGAPQGNDFEKLARDTADVRSMAPADLAAIARIDREITGQDRAGYIKAKLSEAMHDSALRVSLCARLDGTIVGYLMARADVGDFGRTEPVAVIDTIGVDPEYAHRGVGHALMSQLFANLGALQVERVETVVGPKDIALLGFLYDVGFTPSQRLAFVHYIGR
jgi:ribosomal protein S18 acetylase RimI-like enzyme